MANISTTDSELGLSVIIVIIIHLSKYLNSDWSRALSQSMISCELDMINVLSVAFPTDNTFIMSSSFKVTRPVVALTNALLCQGLLRSIEMASSARFASLSEEEINYLLEKKKDSKN